LILHKSCFDTAIIMQNSRFMQWQPKITKERKISQSNVLSDESSQLQKNKDKLQPGSTIVHLRYMAKIVDGKWRFVVKVPNHNHTDSSPEAHPMH